MSIVRVDPAAPERRHGHRNAAGGGPAARSRVRREGSARAFVTTARRGQNLPAAFSPRASIRRVSAARWSGSSMRTIHSPTLRTTLMRPRLQPPESRCRSSSCSVTALGRSRSVRTVAGSMRRSSSRATRRPSSAVRRSRQAASRRPRRIPPSTRTHFPLTGLIVRRDPASGAWRDELARDWGPSLYFFQPDADVFTIDADAGPPALIPSATVAGVGTCSVMRWRSALRMARCSSPTPRPGTKSASSP